MMTKNNNEQVKVSRFEEFRENLKNPIKRAVYGDKVTHVLVSILRGFIFIGLAFIIIFPIFREIVVAVKDPQDLNNPIINWIPEHFSTINIQIAFDIMDYWRSLGNTLKVSLFTAILQVFSTSLAGYALSRLKFKGSNLIFLLILLTLLVPPQVVALSRSLYFSNFDILRIFKVTAADGTINKVGILGLFNGGEIIKLKGEGKSSSLYVLSIFGQGIRAGLFVFLFKQFFRGIPIELEESAQIDGAGVIRTFWSIMLPNARGCITTVSLFAFVWQYNDSYYITAYNISGESFPLLTKKLLYIQEWLGNMMKTARYRKWVALVGSDNGANPYFTKAITSTAALIMMLPLLIGYLFVQRLFIEGVERSGIVG